MTKKLNESFRIESAVLEERLQYSLPVMISEKMPIIPLRDISEIKTAAIMRKDFLEALIKAIPLRSDNSKEFPYGSSAIDVYGVEPKGVEIGQTFVLSSKILGIMSGMTLIFRDFVMKGLSKMPPLIVYGSDLEGNSVTALYVPPVIEHHQAASVLLDGMHRSYICRAAGTTVNAVHIFNVSVPLPFEKISWDAVSLLDQKPPIEKRYHNLNRLLFRDLGYVGIDG